MFQKVSPHQKNTVFPVKFQESNYSSHLFDILIQGYLACILNIYYNIYT